MVPGQVEAGRSPPATRKALPAVVLTVHTGWGRPRRPRHLPREAGALHCLGALLNLVLIAAPVSRDDLAGAGLDVHCRGGKQPHHHITGGYGHGPPTHATTEGWAGLL